MVFPTWWIGVMFSVILRESYGFYFCWWFITNDLWIVIHISNKIKLSSSFRLIENDTISFHRFKSLNELTLINWCVCFCDEIENSFFGYTLLFFVSYVFDCFDDFVFHIQAMCYSPLIRILCPLYRCRCDCKTIQMKMIKHYQKPLGGCQLLCSQNTWIIFIIFYI